MIAYQLKGHNWCPYCLRQAKAFHGDSAPMHGDIGICRECGHTMVINQRCSKNNKLKKPADTDWDWIEASSQYASLLARGHG